MYLCALIKMKRTVAYILPLLLVMIMAGCNHIRIRGGSSADSASINKIIDRQKVGEELRNKGDFYAAIAQHDTCINMSREVNDTMQLIVALNQQGTNYRRIGDLKEASNYHYAALELCDHFSDKTSYAAVKNTVKSLNGLGNVLMTLGNLEAADVLFRRALEGETKLESHTGMAINLANLGSIKQKQGNLDSARIYYNRSMEQNRKDNNAVGISLCYQYLGKLDEISGRIPSAAENYKLSYTTGVATGDIWHWLEPCSALAELYINTHRLDSAQHFVDETIKAAQQIKSMEHLAQAYMLRAKLEEQKGQTAQAFADFKRGHVYEDSILNAANSEHVHNLRMDYETKRHAEEVRKSEEKAAFEHSVTVLVSVSAVLFIFILIFVVIMQLRANRARNEASRTLAEVNEQLRKASNERQLFYRGITHQLRTPLTVVLGMMQQLRKHIPANDKEGIADLDAAQRQSGELLQLVTRLINASKEGDIGVLNEHAMSEIPPATIPAPANTSTQPEPKDTVQPAQPESAPTDGEEPQGEGDNTPLVLVVEDNDDVAMLMCNAFMGEGYRTKRAVDGVDALKMLEADLPDLVVTDIAMPNMNGLELMKHIRADNDMNHLPIIVASARVEDSDRIEGINAGAEVYLAKPFIVDELLLRAQKLIEQRALLRRKFMSADGSVDADMPDMLDEGEREFLENLNEVIDENLMQSNLNSTILSQLMFISRSQLNRKIKNLTDMDTTHYIRERRIQKVKSLLLHTNKTIGEIEVACGYDTQGYLSRMFRQETGMTPSAYRRQMREK